MQNEKIIQSGNGCQIDSFQCTETRVESQTSLKLGCDSFFLAEETSLVLTTVVTPMPKSMPFSWMLFLFSELFFS